MTGDFLVYGLSRCRYLIASSLFFSFVPVGLWISAAAAGVKVGIFNLIGMRLRRVVPTRVVNPLIKAIKAGLDGQHQPAGSAFSGRRQCRQSRQCPDRRPARRNPAGIRTGGSHRPGRPRCAGSRADERQSEGDRNAARCSHRQGRHRAEGQSPGHRPRQYRTPGRRRRRTDHHRPCRRRHRHHDRFGHVTHKDVLENPDRISKTVLSKGLDAGTAFEILSIDIADVDVGRNIGAQLQTDQAEADKRIAQAKAEERRAMAVAREQEMKAAVVEMRAKVVEAEAEVPKAMAQALREGKLGVMDYYNMQNVISDTQMRGSIAQCRNAKRQPGEQ